MPLDPVERVTILESNPEWLVQFGRLASALRDTVGNVIVEHIGSTAISGLAAKPILDVMILFRDAGEAENVRKFLGQIGYVSEGDKGIPGREAFRRTSAATPTSVAGPWMDHHLYLAAEAGEYALVQRQFRDYLGVHPDTAGRYAILKQSLAAAFPVDRDAYTEGKGPFVRAVLAAARIDAEAQMEAAGLPDLIGTRTTCATFAAVDIRVGTVIAARPLPRARRPAIVLEIDFGPIGVVTSSAQVTDHYSPRALLGRQVVAVVNFPPKQIGSVMSECLVLGASDGQGIALVNTDRAVPNGARVH